MNRLSSSQLRPAARVLSCAINTEIWTSSASVRQSRCLIFQWSQHLKTKLLILYCSTLRSVFLQCFHPRVISFFVTVLKVDLLLILRIEASRSLTMVSSVSLIVCRVIFTVNTFLLAIVLTFKDSNVHLHGIYITIYGNVILKFNAKPLLKLFFFFCFRQQRLGFR